MAMEDFIYSDNENDDYHSRFNKIRFFVDKIGDIIGD